MQRLWWDPGWDERNVGFSCHFTPLGCQHHCCGLCRSVSSLQQRVIQLQSEGKAWQGFKSVVAIWKLGKKEEMVDQHWREFWGHFYHSKRSLIVKWPSFRLTLNRMMLSFCLVGAKEKHITISLCTNPKMTENSFENLPTTEYLCNQNCIWQMLNFLKHAVHKLPASPSAQRLLLPPCVFRSLGFWFHLHLFLFLA